MTATGKHKLPAQGVGNIGLYYCCYKLSLLGWNVMPTTRNTRSVDVFIYSQDAKTTRTIQVRTQSHRNSVPVGTFAVNIRAEFLVVVTLSEADTPLCHILPAAEVPGIVSCYGQGMIKALRLEPEDFYGKQEFLEAWERIGRGDG